MTKARDLADGVINTSELADDAITAAKLNVTGNGTAGQFLSSDGDGSMTWADAPEPFSPTTVSGTSQTLDLSSDNYFDGGTHTADTTLAFSNVPTAKLWSYVYKSGTVTTSYNPLNLNPDKTINVSTYSTPVKGLGILSDGTKLYTAKSSGGSSERVAEFTLSTDYDISTASYVREFNATSNVGTLTSFAIKPDGAKFYITHVDFPASKISEFTCSTAGDLSTASHTHTATITTNTTYNVGGLSFSADGTKFYITDDNGGSSSSPAAQVDRYNLSTAWDLSTASYSQSLDTSAYNYYQGGVAINDDGTKLLVGAPNSNDPDTGVHLWTLGTAYDLSTATHTRDLGTTASYGGMTWADSGKYFISHIGDTVRRFSAQQIAGTTITYPSSVQNPNDIVSTNSANDKYKIEFITTDGGTTVWKTGHNIYQDN